MKTKTRFYKLTAWLLTLAILMTFIPSFTLTVNAAEVASGTYTVTVDSPIENGTVAADVSEAAEGDTVTLTVTPASGYELDTLTVKDADDGNVTVTDNKFTMPAKAVTVTATFKESFTVTLSIGTAYTNTVTDFYRGDNGTMYCTFTFPDGVPAGRMNLYVNDEKKNASFNVTANSSSTTLNKTRSTATNLKNGENVVKFEFVPSGSTESYFTNEITVTVYKIDATRVAKHLSGDVDTTVDYDGTPKTVAVTSLYSAGANLLYLAPEEYNITYWQGEQQVAEPTEPGVYDVKITVQENDYYEQITNHKLCTLTINAPVTYTVTISDTIENGTVIADVPEAAEGENVTITVTPNADYTLSSLVVDGKDVTVNITDGKYTFEMPAKNVTVTATFVEIHSVAVSRYAGYTIKRTADTVLPITHGDSYSFTVEITSGYEKTAEFAVKAGNREDESSDLTVLTPDGDGVYTITNITSDKKIQVVGVSPCKPDSIDDFKEDGNYPFKLLCEEDASHSITAPYFDSTYVTVGDINATTRLCEISFNIAKYIEDKLPGHRAAGYIPNNITFWLKWDEEASKWAYYSSVKELTVTCAPETYAVSINPSSNGTVIADKAKAAEGETVTLTVTPNEDYELSTITVWQGGTKLEISGDYTFTMPAGNVTVRATFKRGEYTITFNANGGACETASSKTVNSKLAALPEATRTGYAFDGWFDAQTGGNKITTNTNFTTSTIVYAQWTEITPKITGIAVDETSSAYDAETDTFTVAKDKPFVAFLTGENFAHIDDEFLEKNSFGFVPSVDDSENALGNSLHALKEAGFVTVDTDKNNITLTFDYEAMKAFVAEYGSFEGICYGDIKNIKEENIKPVNIALAKYDPTYTAPTVITGLVYNGTEQALLIPGTADGGTMKYFIGGAQATETVSTGTSAGEYTVTCIVIGDANHNNIVVGEYTVTIAKKTIDNAIVLTAPVENTAPQTEITGTGYTATVVWSPEVTDKFAYNTEYVATVTITPDDNHTVTGIAANGYTVEGAKTVTNDENSNVIIIAYEKTGSIPSYGGGGSSNTSTTTTKNEDGSKTVVTENKATGTKTEVTTNTDGSTTTVVTKKDGTVTTTEKDSEGTKTVTTEKADGTTTTEETKKDGTTVKTETTASGETTAEVEAKGETEIIIPVPDAEEVCEVVVTDEKGNETVITDFEVVDGGVAITVDGNASVSLSKGSKKEFVDVHPVDHWSEDSVDYVYIRGLMKGTSENHFSPDATLTRAMLVTILYRLEGEPKVSGITSFADLEEGQYYLDAVCWAQINCIVNGVSETEFAPNDNITREQFATIMFRYAQYKGLDTVTLEENLHFSDNNEISEYAVSAMNWAVGTGLMNGKSATTINPKNSATRAEAAAILHRFIEANK